MKKFAACFSCIVLFFVLTGCDNQKLNKKEREGEPAIYSVEGDDIEMNKAIQTARATLHKFNSALSAKDTAFNTFTLKVGFPTPDGGKEHIWMSDIVFDKNQYSGIVNNTPEWVTSIKLGDSILIKTGDITDWMYYEGDKIKGAYTMRVIRKRMTAEERDQFDRENGLIED